MVYASFQWSDGSQFYEESEWSLMFHKNSEHHVRMVAQLLRERMVAHDLANSSFGIFKAPSAGRSLNENAWFVRMLPGPRFAPINKIQMKPRFVMAALVGGT